MRTDLTLSSLYVSYVDAPRQSLVVIVSIALVDGVYCDDGSFDADV